MELLERLAEGLDQGRTDVVAELTRQAMDQGVPAVTILNEGLIAGMDTVGEKFRKHQIFLPNVLLAAKAMHAGMDLLKPQLIEQDVPSAGKAVLGTVRGDQHDIGKNLVGIMLAGAGFEVIDLGTDVAPEEFLAAARQHQARVIGMSALLTTTMPVMKEMVELLAAEGLAGQIRTVVGGAPVSEEYAHEIGADAYAFDGVSAVDRFRELLGEGSPS
jgi:5-methyltetrahydrofolate--homocysteine methyltransferase